MKTLLLITGAVLAVSSNGFAALLAPCASGTLASFISNSTGCSVGNENLTGFTALNVPAGSTMIATNAINVSAITTPSMPGLLFTLNSMVGPGALFETNVAFNATAMSGTQIAGSTLNQIGGTASLDAAVTGVETVCLNANVNTSGLGACPAGAKAGKSPGTFALAGLTQTSDFVNFITPRSLIGVIGDFSVGGGIAGSASLTSFSIQLNEVAASAVPEPSSIILCGCGLLGLALRRRWNHS